MRNLHLVTLIFLFSCTNRFYHIYSPDKTQSFTICETPEFRYIIAGNFSSLPDSNYVKIKIDSRAAQSDELAGCWKTNGHEWEISIHKAIVVENKLDTSKYLFSTKVPLDKNLGIPFYESFTSNGCYHFDFEFDNFLVSPENAVILEK